jgi:hypothetical protein
MTKKLSIRLVMIIILAIVNVSPVYSFKNDLIQDLQFPKQVDHYYSTDSDGKTEELIVKEGECAVETLYGRIYVAEEMIIFQEHIELINVRFPENYKALEIPFHQIRRAYAK